MNDKIKTTIVFDDLSEILFSDSEVIHFNQGEKKLLIKIKKDLPIVITNAILESSPVDLMEIVKEKDISQIFITYIDEDMTEKSKVYYATDETNQKIVSEGDHFVLTIY